MFGTIFDYNPNRGYGFISLKSGRRIFFHISSYNGEAIPTPGMSVEFDLGAAKKFGKPDQAVHVIPAETTVGGVS